MYKRILLVTLPVVFGIFFFKTVSWHPSVRNHPYFAGHYKSELARFKATSSYALGTLLRKSGCLWIADCGVLDLYISAADSGHIMAAYHVAQAYDVKPALPVDERIKAETDTKLAFKFYLKAARTGFPSAQYHIARKFYSGVGTAVDRSQARFWLQKAARNGDTRAKIMLGLSEKRVACPSDATVIFAFGQSNAANSGENRYTPMGNVLMAYEGACYKASDPLPGATGTGGSVWTRLADILIKEYGHETIVLQSVAVGGTSIDIWQHGGNGYPSLVTGLGELREIGLEPSSVLFHHGEADAFKMDPKEYRSKLSDIISVVRRIAGPAQIFVSTATVCGAHQTPDQKLKQAVASLIGQRNGVFHGPDTDQLTEANHRYDQCHFSGHGLDAAAAMWAKAIMQKR